MNLFSFLSGEEVHLPPGEKIIKEEDFTTLLSAAELLEKAKNEIEKRKMDLEKEGEEIHQKAQKEGFEEGLAQFNEALVTLENQKKELQEEYEKKLVPIAIQAAKKILGEELKLHPDRIRDIVIQALKPVSQHRRIKIYVNKADLELLEKEKPKIKEILEQVDTLSIQERSDVQPQGCIIETEAGIINAQLETQLRALENAFKKLLKKG